VAEEIVQEAWISVLGAIDRFEGRATLRTWIFTILINCARRVAVTEGRSVPFAAAGRPGDDGEPGRFFDADHPRWAGMWSTNVDAWRWAPEERLLAREVREVIAGAVAGLPLAQRDVFLLCDVEGWPVAEVRSALGLAGGNQRVLLHRARATVRGALGAHLGTAA
jgi:RNA polymerase sigma-70 factor (ECF subfamily)